VTKDLFVVGRARRGRRIALQLCRGGGGGLGARVLSQQLRRGHGGGGAAHGDQRGARVGPSLRRGGVKGCSAAAGAGSRGQRKGRWRWARLASLVIFGAKSELSVDTPAAPAQVRVTYTVASTQDPARATPNEWARARDPSVKGQKTTKLSQGFWRAQPTKRAALVIHHPSPVTARTPNKNSD